VTFAADLLEQAQHLATREPNRPRQASLRRAVSSAYYSLFHLIVDDATKQLISIARFRSSVARSIDHKDVRKAATALLAAARNPQPNQRLVALARRPIAPPLVDFCSAFIDLQDRRHEADYDVTAVFTRSQVLSFLSVAQPAHAAWKTQRATENAAAFLLAASGLLSDR
jgi:uncharacterized protein (UPF0332 family)